MKTLFIFLLFSSSVLGQAFTAETGDIYLGDAKGDYSGLLIVRSGLLKVTDPIEIYSSKGFKYLVRIVKMKDINDTKKELKQLSAGQEAYIEFVTADEPKSYDDALRKGMKVYPKGFKPDGASLAANTKKADFMATLDGQPFKAAVAYKGATLWRKGVKNFASNKPYLLLQFGSIVSPDDRILTIQLFNPKETIARYGPKDMEVNFSGTTDGKKENTTIYGFVNGKADTDFIVEITKWQAVSNTKAIISGKLYGDLREVKVLGVAKKINRFENATFDNIEVEIINTQLDLSTGVKDKN
ncbi:hypothetical protein [Emticicia sp. 17c]|uniref:hypothetical protein n=1 Tax=Emticicia sp. 17c TaxID=3127704 RepID=UPI00301CE8D1